MIRGVTSLVVVATLVPIPAKAGDLIGRASVVDGDTVEIQSQHIRIFGIDAPESSQLCTDKAGAEYRCGKMAANALDEFLAQSRPLTCNVVDHDRNHRAVARCNRSD